MKDLDSVKKIILTYKGLGTFLKEDSYIDLNGQEEQLSCPFHGKDNKPSARYYPDTDTMYCWTCQQSWDIFRYLGDKKDYDFGSSINFLLQKFGIDTSSLPDVKDRIKRLEIGKTETKIDRKNILLIKLEDKISSLRQKVTFDKYNKVAFGFLLIKSMVHPDTFNSDCAQLIKEIKDLG